jgi:hypothetical protein
MLKRIYNNGTVVNSAITLLKPKNIFCSLIVGETSAKNPVTATHKSPSNAIISIISKKFKPIFVIPYALKYAPNTIQTIVKVVKSMEYGE